MEKNDFQITNDLLDKIVGGKNSANLFAGEFAAGVVSSDNVCSTSCVESCSSSYGSNIGSVVGHITNPDTPQQV